MFENSFISILYKCSPCLVCLWDYWLLIHDLFLNDFEANWENMKILTVCWVWVLRLWNVLRLDNILHFHSLIHSVKFIVWESGKKGNKQTWSKQKRCKKINFKIMDTLKRIPNVLWVLQSLSPRINTHQFLAQPFCGGTARSCSRLLLEKLCCKL